MLESELELSSLFHAAAEAGKAAAMAGDSALSTAAQARGPLEKTFSKRRPSNTCLFPLTSPEKTKKIYQPIPSGTRTYI
jgi:hypothetical protein